MLNQLHKKQYEDTYTVDKWRHKLDLNKISGVTSNFDEYTDLFNDFLKTFYVGLYSDFVKLSWLRRNFVYNGKRMRYPITSNGQYINGMFVKYLRRIVGMDIQIFTRGIAYSAIETYFNEFYPDFDEENPFENPEYYTFPFRHVSMEFLVPVSQMDERLLLLNEAEERKLSFASFQYLVTNEVLCINQELGRFKYEASPNYDRRLSFFVKNMDRIKKIKKRK